MVSIEAQAASSTSITLTWKGVTALSLPSGQYVGVRIDEYREQTLSALKPNAPLPPAEQSQGGDDSPSTPSLSPLDGSVTLFTNLLPNTSYVFVLYGLISLGSGGALQPARLAQTDPTSTQHAPSSSTAKEFPALGTSNFPKTLTESNRIVVRCANANIYDHWLLSVNSVQQTRQLIASDTFTIASEPLQTFVLNADGKLHNADYTGWGPPVPVKAGPNSNSIVEFLQNSGRSGTEGLRVLLNESQGRTIRGLLGV